MTAKTIVLLLTAILSELQKTGPTGTRKRILRHSFIVAFITMFHRAGGSNIDSFAKLNVPGLFIIEKLLVHFSQAKVSCFLR